MAAKIGINGFGRIGRLTLRAINRLHSQKLEVAVVNDLTDAGTNAHLFKYDSTYGIYPGSVEAQDNALIIDDKKIQVIAERCGCGYRVHRTFHRWHQSSSPPSGRCKKSDHLGTGKE